MTKLDLKIEGKFPVILFREGETVVAHSPVLDLSSYGDTAEEARKNFSEAMGLFIEECARMGTLLEVLKSCGCQVKKGDRHQRVI